MQRKMFVNNSDEKDNFAAILKLKLIFLPQILKSLFEILANKILDRTTNNVKAI